MQPFWVGGVDAKERTEVGEMGCGKQTDGLTNEVNDSKQHRME